MGFRDIFKINEYKQRINELEAELEEIKTAMPPEAADAVDIQKHINELTRRKETLNSEISEQQEKIKSINTDISAKNRELVQLDDEILLQSFGLYEPKYDFVNSERYNIELQRVRQKQKDMIKSNTATIGNMNWVVNENKRQGQKLVKDMQKLLLRAFNSECDSLVEKVKYNTFNSYVKRITSSYNAVSKLGAVMGISITPQYYDLKIEELTIAFEYRLKKQEEKERQRELREQMREEAKLQKEIDEQRGKIKKEQTHYQNALRSVLERISEAPESERAELLIKKNEIERKLAEIDIAIKDIDYREANQRAGYVYIISNIGSFGENVYKIGMTRRLDPMERVDELGDASVPFKFDVHAMIFSDDAPALENSLHKAFDARKLNLVNQRREFFNVTLDEIKQVVKDNYDKTVEFIDLADAEQYRISEKMRQGLNITPSRNIDDINKEREQHKTELPTPAPIVSAKTDLPINEPISKADKRENNISDNDDLSLPELLMIHYADTFYEGIDTFQSFWKYEYDVNPGDIIKSLLDKKYIAVGGAETSLNIKTVSELKDFLKANELPVTGKKIDLIARILKSVPKEKIETFATPRKYIVTEKGKSCTDKINIALFVHRNSGYGLSQSDIKDALNGTKDILDIAFNKAYGRMRFYQKSGDWNMVAQLLYDLADIASKKKAPMSALKYHIKAMCIDLSGAGNKDGIQEHYMKPGEDCCIITPYNIETASSLIDKASITAKQFSAICRTEIDDMKLPYSYYSKSQIKEKLINSVFELRGENITYTAT